MAFPLRCSLSPHTHSTSPPPHRQNERLLEPQSRTSTTEIYSRRGRSEDDVKNTRLPTFILKCTLNRVKLSSSTTFLLISTPTDGIFMIIYGEVLRVLSRSERYFMLLECTLITRRLQSMKLYVHFNKFLIKI